MYKFNAEKAKDGTVEWIRKWFKKNGENCTAVVGISGGKDSSVVAALCVEALGKDRVHGVLMPNGTQHDIDCAFKLVKHLGIDYSFINIKEVCDTLTETVETGLHAKTNEDFEMSQQAKTNMPARIRMTVLYAVSQTIGGRVLNTCNLSEDYVGYATRYGDGAGDLSPLANFTVEEVKAIGHVLGLPDMLVEKTPTDGLCGKTDEDNLGFTYEVLDNYIRTKQIADMNLKNKIDEMHEKNQFKIMPMPSYGWEWGKYYEPVKED